MQTQINRSHQQANLSPYRMRLFEQLQTLTKTSVLSASIYDMAWLVWLANPTTNTPRFPDLIDQIVQAQHTDGSWRHTTIYDYSCDAIICTLSAVTALARWSDSMPQLNPSIEQGVQFLNRKLHNGIEDTYMSVGYEILLPALLDEAMKHGIVVKSIEMNNFITRQKAKMQTFIEHTRYHAANTTLHSLEAFSQLDVEWSQIVAVQDTNGSYLSSPAATVVMYLKTGDERGLQYLDRLVANQGTVPVNTPIDLFELNWCYEMICNLNLQSYFPAEFQKAIQQLRHHWTERGMSWSSTFNLPDLDNTSVTYDLLRRTGMKISPAVFDYFHDDKTIYCFPNEADSSPTHLLHLITAIMHDPSMQTLQTRALHQVRQLFQQNGWYDKWHLSSYYVIALSVKPFAYLQCPELDDMLVYIMTTQNDDGGWGLTSNPEETAWACYSLLQMIGLQDIASHIEQMPQLRESLDHGITYLKSVSDTNQTLPCLWIDKCLYTPVTIVNVLIQSVLLRYTLSFDD